MLGCKAGFLGNYVEHYHQKMGESHYEPVFHLMPLLLPGCLAVEGMFFDILATWSSQKSAFIVVLPSPIARTAIFTGLHCKRDTGLYIDEVEYVHV